MSSSARHQHPSKRMVLLTPISCGAMEGQEEGEREGKRGLGGGGGIERGVECK